MNKYAKAVVAALAAAYAIYVVASGADSPAGSGITLNEWIGVITTALIAGGATWAVPNTPNDSVGKHSEE